MSESDKSIASFIMHGGKEIYYLDYTNHKTTESLAEAIRTARSFRKKTVFSTGRKDMLILVNLTNSFVFGEGYNELKISGKELKSLTLKRAVVGLNNSKSILLNAYNRLVGADYRAFKSIEEAKDWLVS